MNFQQTYNQTQGTKSQSCLYNTQGNVVCDPSTWKNCEEVPVKTCTNAYATCTDMNCKDKNVLLFARFQDEKNTWR